MASDLWRRAHSRRFLVQLLARRRQRHDPGIDELDDLLRVHVHEDADPFDRPAVEVRGVALEVGHRTKETSPLKPRCDLTHSPVVDLNVLEVADAAFAHRVLPACIPLYDAHERFELRLEYDRLDSFHFSP